jgi:hypothetical protein
MQLDGRPAMAARIRRPPFDKQANAISILCRQTLMLRFFFKDNDTA